MELLWGIALLIGMLLLSHLTMLGANQASLRARQQQFAEVARSLQADLLRLALRLTHPDREAAEDLVQDALIKGFKAFSTGQLDLTPYIKSWFMQVIANDFRSSRRRDKFKSDVQIDDLNTESTLGLPEEDLESSRRVVALRDAIKELPEHQRSCVLLVDIDGNSYEDAAKILDVPVGTVRSRLSRARLRLAEVLTNAEVSVQ